MGKDILTPKKIQSYAERDYSTPKAHCDLDIMQKAEQVNTISKINPHTDEDVLAMMDESTKMSKEGVLAEKKTKSRTPVEREIIETFLINKTFNIDEKKGQYIDKRGHIRTHKEKTYALDVKLLKKIVSLHPIIKSVNRLNSVCEFPKATYQRMTTSKTSCRKTLNKKRMKKIAHILELDDWRTLIDEYEHDLLTRKEVRIQKVKTEMQDYRNKIKDLQKELQLEKEIKNA
tara:strand:- start:257 stop:949 length:693 start_codon:yes stop_codon:yes gene_type:complete